MIGGFLEPGLLALGGLALPLILLYVLKVRRDRVDVSANRLWAEALAEVEAQVPFRRLRRNWLLLLQLLILLLIVLAAAAPFRRTLLRPGRSTAIVLDASASMMAAGRFDDALARARGLVVDELGIPTRYADEESHLNPVWYGLRCLRVMLRYRLGRYA